MVAEQHVKAVPALLRAQTLQIGGLHQADHLDALLIEIVKEAGQLHTRPVHVLRRDLPLPKALRAKQNLEMKVVDDSAKTDPRHRRHDLLLLHSDT